MLINDLKNTQVFAFGHVPAVNTSTATGTGRDFLQGDGNCHAVLSVGTVTGTSPTCDVKIQESSDNSTFTDISGATFTQVTATGTAPVAITFQRTLRYLRSVATIGGTSPSFPLSVVLMEGKKHF